MAKIKFVILGIAIVMVLTFFFGYGIDTFYKDPKYEDFCGEREFKNYEAKEECEANNGKWTGYGEERPIPMKPVEVSQYSCTSVSENEDGTLNINCESKNAERSGGYCEIDFYCRKDYNNARQVYNRNVFVISVIFGLIAIVVGTYLKITSVSAGIMGGGVLIIIYGSLRYWADMNEYFRFGILAITLAVLIWIGYKKFKK